jgi:hypothetical protein
LDETAEAFGINNFSWRLHRALAQEGEEEAKRRMPKYGHYNTCWHTLVLPRMLTQASNQSTEQGDMYAHKKHTTHFKHTDEHTLERTHTHTTLTTGSAPTASVRAHVPGV